MTSAWQIVHSVLDRFRGLPVKLAAMNGKSEEWYRSHGREPKTLNPDAGGNVSEVEHYMRYARRYEACERGAGRMLSTRVHAELEAEFTEQDLSEVSQSVIEVGVIDETCDVQKWLATFDIDSASRRDLVQFIDECKQAEEAISIAKSRATVRLKLEGVNGNGTREIAKAAVRNRRGK